MPPGIVRKGPPVLRQENSREGSCASGSCSRCRLLVHGRKISTGTADRGRPGTSPDQPLSRCSPCLSANLPRVLSQRGAQHVVPAGVRPNRWVPRGFSSNASSRPDAPDGGQNAGRHGAQARAGTQPSTAAAARSAPPACGRPISTPSLWPTGHRRRRRRTTTDTWCEASPYQVRSGS